MRDVAIAAGVSPKTVSNVVNDYVHVRPETRARVQRHVDAMGYRPQAVGRQLRRGRTGSIALVNFVGAAVNLGVNLVLVRHFGLIGPAAATLAAARDDAARITDDARHAADALVSEAQARAEEVRHRSEQDLKRRREAAEQELRRVEGLHESVRNEMGRLHKLLGSELTSSPENAPFGGDGADSPATRPVQRERSTVG